MEVSRVLFRHEEDIVDLFKIAAEMRMRCVGVDHDWNIPSIAAEAGIDVMTFPKEGVLVQALWIAFLQVMRDNTDVADIKMKYPTFEIFRSAYAEYFRGNSQQDLECLWHIANWMAVLFTLIPAKKNKGLAMAVIPKLVEGWFVKYVTGSGQTKATTDRVMIFQREGNILPNQRGKSKLRPRIPLKEQNIPKRSPAAASRRKQRFARDSGFCHARSRSGSSLSSASTTSSSSSSEDSWQIHRGFSSASETTTSSDFSDLANDLESLTDGEDESYDESDDVQEPDTDYELGSFVPDEMLAEVYQLLGDSPCPMPCFSRMSSANSFSSRSGKHQPIEFNVVSDNIKDQDFCGGYEEVDGVEQGIFTEILMMGDM